MAAPKLRTGCGVQIPPYLSGVLCSLRLGVVGILQETEASLLFTVLFLLCASRHKNEIFDDKNLPVAGSPFNFEHFDVKLKTSFLFIKPTNAN